MRNEWLSPDQQNAGYQAYSWLASATPGWHSTRVFHGTQEDARARALKFVAERIKKRMLDALQW